MLCHECFKAGKNSEAVGLCHSCSAGLRGDHACVTALPVTATYLFMTVVLPIGPGSFFVPPARGHSNRSR